MSMMIAFRKTPKDIVKWEIIIRIEKWILVFRRWGILLWRPSPLIFYYLNWRNPYTRELRFTAGIMSYAKRDKGSEK